MQPVNLRGKLLVAALVSLSPILVLVGVLSTSLVGELRAGRQVRHTLEVIAEAAELGAQVFEMQIGIGGVLVGDVVVPEAVEQQYQESLLRMTALRARVTDNPEQLKRLDDVAAGIQAWRAEVAPRFFEPAPRNDRVAAVALLTQSREALQAVRAELDAFVRVEKTALATRAAAHSAAHTRTLTVVLLGGLLAVAAALAAALVLGGRMIGPLQRVMAAAEAVATGDITRRVPVTGSDAVGRLATAVNTMAATLAHRQEALDRAHAEAETLLSIARLVGGTGDIEEALRRMCRALSELTGADTAIAYTLDAGRTELSPTATYRVPQQTMEHVTRTRIPVAERGLRDGAFGQERVTWSDDIARDGRFAYEGLRGFPHRSGAAIPIVLDGEVSGAFYLVWWHTARRFGEAELETLRAIGQQAGMLVRNARLYAESRGRGKRLDALIGITRSITESLDPEALLPVIAEETLSLFTDAACRLWILEGDRLRLRAQAGLRDPRGAPHAELPPGEGLAGRACATGEPVLLDDVTQATELGSPDWLRAEGFVSGAVLPLLVGERSIGVFVLFTRERRTFGADEVSVLQSFAEQAAIALEKARLFQDSQERRRLTEGLFGTAQALEATTELRARLDAFLRGVSDTLGFERVNVLLATEDGGALEIVAGTELGADVQRRLPLGEGAGALQLVWRSGETLLVTTDVELEALPPLASDLAEHPMFGARQFAVVPLRFQGRPIGLVMADNRRSRRAVTRRAVAQLEVFSQQLAASVSNARLYAQTRRREREAAVLLQVCRRLSATLEVDDVLELIVDGAVEATGCDAAGFYRWDAARGALAFVRGRHLDDLLRGFLLRPGEGVGGRAYTERGPVWTADRLAEPLQGYSLQVQEVFTAGRTPRASAAVPVVIGDEVYGVLINHYMEPHAYEQAEVKLLEAFAAQAAVAVDHARLRAESRQSLAGAVLLNDAVRALHGTADARHPAPEALAALGKTFGAVGAAITLLEGDLEAAAHWGTWSPEAAAALAPSMRAREEPLLLDAPGAIPDGLAARGVRSLAAFALRGRRPLGAVVLAFDAQREFSEAELRLLAAYADQLALAMESAALLEEVEAGKTRLEHVLAATSDGVLELDLDGRISALNRHGGDMLGVPADEHVGRPFTALLAARGDALVFTGAVSLPALLESGLHEGAGEIAVAGTPPRALRWRAQATRDLVGNAVGSTVTLQDVTREREVERMKAELMSTVAQELRAPMASIKGSLILLCSEPDIEANPAQRELVNICLSNTDRLLRLLAEWSAADSGATT